MSEPLEIEVDATHLYPGARGRLTARAPTPNHPVPCALIFSDLARADAILALIDAESGQLDVKPYVTRAGTRIAAKAWRISLSRQAEILGLHVRSRVHSE